MLDNKGFDLWADGYDRSVNISDEDNSYPFAGYKKVLAGIYDAIRKGQGKRVLDIGFGTGVLAGKLYENGYDITGIDFSERMIQIAQEKMPSARLIQHDFPWACRLRLPIPNSTQLFALMRFTIWMMQVR